MNLNKKSINVMILSVLVIILSIVGLPYIKANASSTITDKNKVALYYREKNYCYRGTIQYRNLIKVPKEFRHKCTVSLKYKLSIDNVWTSNKAEFYESLDNQYDIYVASCGIIGPEYELYIECDYGDNCYNQIKALIKNIAYNKDVIM